MLQGFGGGTQITIARPQSEEITTEKNVVMGPGIPGSVDKGQLEERGERLLITNKQPMSAEEFRIDLSF